MKLFPLVLIAAALTATTLSASAQSTTFTLSGTVFGIGNDVLVPLPPPWDAVVAGDPFSLTYTFDNGAHDSNSSPSIGEFYTAVTSFTFTAGAASMSQTIPPVGSLRTYTGLAPWADVYSGSMGGAPSSLSLTFELRDATGIAFDGHVPRDGLPSCLELNAFASRYLTFGTQLPFGSQFICMITSGTTCTEPGHTSCAGDGSPFACPCGNLGAPGHGCRNGANTHGARLRATGFANSEYPGGPGPDTLQFQVTGMPSSTSCMLISGTASLSPPPFLGNGLRCCGGSVRRLAVHVTSGGSTTFGVANPGEVISMLSQAPAGTTMCYQVWYRDATGPCSISSNLSNGYEIGWN